MEVTLPCFKHTLMYKFVFLLYIIIILRFLYKHTYITSIRIQYNFDYNNYIINVSLSQVHTSNIELPLSIFRREIQFCYCIGRNKYCENY